MKSMGVFFFGTQKVTFQVCRAVYTLCMRFAWVVQGFGYLLIVGVCVYLSAYQHGPVSTLQTASTTKGIVPMTTLTVLSPAFEHEGLIPSKYTCDGDNVSPPLAIDGIPKGTVSLVLVVEDPDVPWTIREDGVWDHWVVFNMPPDTTRIAEGEIPQGTLGRTTQGVRAYGGPCPPDGEHRYLFRVYALDTWLRLPEGSTKKEVLEMSKGHVLESTTLMGRYRRENSE